MGLTSPRRPTSPSGLAATFPRFRQREWRRQHKKKAGRGTAVHQRQHGGDTLQRLLLRCRVVKERKQGVVLCGGFGCSLLVDTKHGCAGACPGWIDQTGNVVCMYIYYKEIMMCVAREDDRLRESAKTWCWLVAFCGPKNKTLGGRLAYCCRIKHGFEKMKRAGCGAARKRALPAQESGVFRVPAAL